MKNKRKAWLNFVYALLVSFALAGCVTYDAGPDNKQIATKQPVNTEVKETEDIGDTEEGISAGQDDKENHSANKDNIGSKEEPEESAKTPTEEPSVNQEPTSAPVPTAKPVATVTPTPKTTATPVLTKAPVEEKKFSPEQIAAAVSFDTKNVPAYSSNAYVAINGNIPFFAKEQLVADSFEYYSPLDSLGRCGTCVASIGRDIMPTEDRGEIGSVKPSGWNQAKYAGLVDGNYLYNRCHLIGFQLTGENANTKNLITGTRYLNVDGMLPFENMVADYVKETGNHVMYRITPVFEGKNLLASGVLMEAYSVEDDGEGICFCVYCYNVQPGVTISYSDGASVLAEEEETPEEITGTLYVLNTNTKKFHKPACSSVSTIKASNYSEFAGNRQELIDAGYVACKRCHP